MVLSKKIQLPVLEIENLTFKYNKHATTNIINQINFSINKNEIIAIAGPNGAGKTTFLKLLVGLLKPQTGSIKIDNKEISNSKDLLHSIGLVFQNPDEQVFFPKIEEDIAFGLQNLGIGSKEIEAKVHEVMHKLKITYLSGRTFFSLSFGEKKKISLAGVLVTKPEILILDEPTIGLDPWSKKEFIEILKDLAEDSTLLIATHDYDLLKEADRIYFLWEGSFIEVFDNFTLFEQFAEKFTVKRE